MSAEAQEEGRAQAATKSGVSTLGLLGVCFIVLKLLNLLDWSWWWVTSPFWIPTAVFLLCFGLIMAFYGGVFLFYMLHNKYYLWKLQRDQNKDQQTNPPQDESGT